MKTLFSLTLAVGLGFGATAQAASSMPSTYGANAAPSGIIQVEGGCGPGGHRDRFGYCRPNFYRPPPPRAYGCPPYTHPTPYGCRRNF